MCVITLKEKRVHAHEKHFSFTGLQLIKHQDIFKIKTMKTKGINTIKTKRKNMK